MSISRRTFVKTSIAGSLGLGIGLNMVRCNTLITSEDKSELHLLAKNLLYDWMEGITVWVEQHPDMMCPACGLVHGRCGDAIYPLLHMARHSGESRYLNTAMQLWEWMEKHISQEDGSWLNNPVEGAWKGTTVFGAIAIAEAIKYHGEVLEPKVKTRMLERLKKAGDYIYNNFSMSYGNINYPVTAAHGLNLLGKLLDEKKFVEKGRYFAHESLRFITEKDKFIFGEGKPLDKKSPKGCLPVDLGYNVEESLQALALYGLDTGDNEVLEVVVESLRTHMEFMLPNGAWDNSWGTRNFKWTYWGSRTSDGCQPAYTLLADRDARFYKVALQNTRLLKECTNYQMLHGGPHYVSHGVQACVHHTFCHAKALTVILDHKADKPVVDSLLPREEKYGVKAFDDIQTWLISTGEFRATVTGYDVEYSMTGGHATGGALSLLWHEIAGPILTASMSRYQMKEAHNMQTDNDPDSMPLTPRIEVIIDGKLYTNIHDLKAYVSYSQINEGWLFKVRSKLVDENQASPSVGDFNCNVTYTFLNQSVDLTFDCDRKHPELRIILPVVSKQSEKVIAHSEKHYGIQKTDNHELAITTSKVIKPVPIAQKRIFNFVPGFEAIPFEIRDNQAEIKLEVKS